ncbi:MAG: NAD(P)-dependent oxidoreductase [Ottowia sp.]|nr:NAD(P)-dependent oxidoreductase [Ottowia sp.]
MPSTTLNQPNDGVKEHMSSWSLEQDLHFICHAVGGAWEKLRDKKIFITGGTGFIGCWLLESLRYANMQRGLNIQATVLTRDPDTFRKIKPHLAQYPGFTLLMGDITQFNTDVGNYTHLIHAATDASAQLNEENPRQMFDTVINGTRRALDFAVDKSIERVLFLSSGAVYGQQPWEMEHVSEDWLGAPHCLDARATYAQAKRAAETLCAIYAKQFDTQISIARIFALLGPFLKLDTHFAAGNFIRDAMAGKPVIVNGNGLPCRSYLYAADLTVWLWRMLVDGKPNQAYNVGSNESVSVKQLAQRVATVLAKGEYSVLSQVDAGWNPGRYVPNTKAIEKDLGLVKTVSLDEAILRTALWNGWKGKK